MNFKSWLKKNSMNYTQASKLLDVTRQTISAINRGKARPSLMLALKIEKLTKGQVGVSRWK